MLAICITGSDPICFKRVVVVSAMSGETNRLTGLAHEISKAPKARELDVLLSTGDEHPDCELPLHDPQVRDPTRTDLHLAKILTPYISRR